MALAAAATSFNAQLLTYILTYLVLTYLIAHRQSPTPLIGLVTGYA